MRRTCHHYYHYTQTKHHKFLKPYVIMAIYMKLPSFSLLMTILTYLTFMGEITSCVSVAFVF